MIVCKIISYSHVLKNVRYIFYKLDKNKNFKDYKDFISENEINQANFD